MSRVKPRDLISPAGVPTELQLYPGAFHAFELQAATFAISQRTYADYMDALKRALNHR